jgi:hypothetical protein
MKDLNKRMKEQYENRSDFYLARRCYAILRMKIYPKVDLENHLNSLVNFANFVPNLQMGFTQGNEVSFLFCDFWKPNTQQWLDGNIQAISSLSSSYLTRFLCSEGLENFYVKSKCFNIPDSVEVYNYFLGRQSFSNNLGFTILRYKKFVAIKSPNFKEDKEFLTMLLPRYPKLDKYDS